MDCFNAAAASGNNPQGHPDNSDRRKPLLQRMMAVEQPDQNAELIDFIRLTMNKSTKDRNIILRIEADLTAFIQLKSEGGTSTLPFPSMSSYHRMLVHRISTLFNLDHNVDPLVSNSVVVSKTPDKSGKLLPFKFKELIHEQKIIIHREGSQATCEPAVSKPAQKTLEERTEDYNKVRQRIFDQRTDWREKKFFKVESFDQARDVRRDLKINKAASFGGYNSNFYPPGLSPASSGYKSHQSYGNSSELINMTPPPPASTLYTSQPPTTVAGQQKVLWAITDINAVPNGAIILDPNTGQQMIHTTQPQQDLYRPQYYVQPNQYYYPGPQLYSPHALGPPPYPPGNLMLLPQYCNPSYMLCSASPPVNNNGRHYRYN